MEGLAIAVIGVVGAVIPSLIALGSVHVRLLRRVRDEVQTFRDLPKDFVQERELLRYLINQSVWDYARSRRRLMRFLPMVTLAFLSTCAAAVGISFIQNGDPDHVFTVNHDVNYRFEGFLLVAAGVLFYIRALLMPFLAARRRTEALQKAPRRSTQLIALEAQSFWSGPLSSVQVDEPNSDPWKAPSQRLHDWAWGDLPKAASAIRSQEVDDSDS